MTFWDFEPKNRPPVFGRPGDTARIDQPLENLTRAQIEAMQWYYRIELKPGCFTQGREFSNMAATHHMLRQIDVRGLKALDIGAMEGAFAVLLNRAGAAVDLYDRTDLSDRVKLVAEAYECELPYLGGAPFHEFVASHIAAGNASYELVLFSGVLYHTIDPMLFLHLIRSLMNPGALMILETSLLIDDENCLYFNEAGRYYPGSNYYQVSSTWLDYALRILGYRIHNAVHIPSWGQDGSEIARVALICELGEEPVVAREDVWARRRLYDYELDEWQRRPNATPVDLASRLKRTVTDIGAQTPDLLHPEIESLRLTDVLRRNGPQNIDRRWCTRHLSDRL